MSNVNGALREHKRTRVIRNIPVKAGEVIHKNDLVIWDNGNTRAIAGVSTGSALKCAGVSLLDVTGGASDGDVTVDVAQGEYELTNSATNAIDMNNVANGATAYIEGVGTVGDTSGTLTAAGPLIGMNGSNPIVRIEY